MKVSTIIPIYNEESTIEAFQDSIRFLNEESEVIFVDGGSTDRTLELIRPEFKVIQSGKGRAVQMNTAAKQSTGDILFFLHCDSEAPRTAIAEICEVMKKYDFGCFGIKFHSHNIWMTCCQIISNHRIKDRKVVFGDQGIFIKRELFFAVGGFPNLPIMEDYQFSLTLKEKGVKIGIAKSRIYTSDRRFVEGGRLRVMWKMNRLRAMYRKGVDINEISKMYRDIR